MKGFIEITKVSNKKVKSPTLNRYVDSDEYEFKKESIPVQEIKSFRPWDKDVDQEALIEGEITKIHFNDKIIVTKEGNHKTITNQIMILESYDSFCHRLNVIRLQNGEGG